MCSCHGTNGDDDDDDDDDNHDDLDLDGPASLSLSLQTVYDDYSGDVNPRAWLCFLELADSLRC